MSKQAVEIREIPCVRANTGHFFYKGKPIGSMYGIFAYILGLSFMVNVGKYTIHGSFGKKLISVFLVMCFVRVCGCVLYIYPIDGFFTPTNWMIKCKP